MPFLCERIDLIQSEADDRLTWEIQINRQLPQVLVTLFLPTPCGQLMYVNAEHFDARQLTPFDEGQLAIVITTGRDHAIGRMNAKIRDYNTGRAAADVLAHRALAQAAAHSR